MVLAFLLAINCGRRVTFVALIVLDYSSYLNLVNFQEVDFAVLFKMRINNLDTLRFNVITRLSNLRHSFGF